MIAFLVLETAHARCLHLNSTSRALLPLLRGSGLIPSVPQSIGRLGRQGAQLRKVSSFPHTTYPYGCVLDARRGDRDVVRPRGTTRRQSSTCCEEAHFRLRQPRHRGWQTSWRPPATAPSWVVFFAFLAVRGMPMWPFHSHAPNARTVQAPTAGFAWCWPRSLLKMGGTASCLFPDEWFPSPRNLLAISCLWPRP